jgi:co-chaperonin GroES (HSP10)
MGSLGVSAISFGSKTIKLKAPAKQKKSLKGFGDTVKVGDIVYPMWTKSKVVKDGDKYMGIISQEDILAVEE